VQRTPGEASAWQVLIDGAKTEWERPGLLRPALGPSNLEPQIGKPVLLPEVHGIRAEAKYTVDDVPIMFSYFDESNARRSTCEFRGERYSSRSAMKPLINIRAWRRTNDLGPKVYSQFRDPDAESPRYEGSASLIPTNLARTVPALPEPFFPKANRQAVRPDEILISSYKDLSGLPFY
jgi:hypothetical protein